MAKTAAFWFRHRYNLPPTDPRFLDATLEQILTDYWAHHYLARSMSGKPNEEEFEDDDFEIEGSGDLDAFPEHLMPNDFEEIDMNQASGDVPGN